MEAKVIFVSVVIFMICLPTVESIMAGGNNMWGDSPSTESQVLIYYLIVLNGELKWDGERV